METLMQELCTMKEEAWREMMDRIEEADRKGFKTLREARQTVEVREAEARYDALCEAFSLVSDKIRQLRNLVAEMADFDSRTAEKRAARIRESKSTII